MIQYDITSDHLRIGYIEKSALPKNADVDPLNLGDLNVTVNGTTYLTDDPLKSRSVLCRYEAGKTLTLRGGTWLLYSWERGLRCS